ncbi:hypothetical protein Golob_009626, partial [Gossypium lobatum]|nr:hypothetical protein [Gossypium lobatum]
MKGITHGACDYLLKPVRIEELKNIWQHVVRKNKPDFKDHVNALNQDNRHEDEDLSIRGGMFGRLNSSAALSLHGISSSVIQPGHCRTSNNPINGSGKIQPAV